MDARARGTMSLEWECAWGGSVYYLECILTPEQRHVAEVAGKEVEVRSPAGLAADVALEHDSKDEALDLEDGVISRLRQAPVCGKVGSNGDVGGCRISKEPATLHKPYPGSWKSRQQGATVAA